MMTKQQIVAKTKEAMKRGSDGSGSYGSYFRLERKVGVKILNGNRYFATMTEFKESAVYKRTFKEATMLRKAAERCNITPKFYGLHTFKWGKKLYAAIAMEHICGKLVEDCRDKEEMMEGAIEKLKEYEVYYRDRNSRNFIYTRKKIVRVIDFSCDWVKVKAYSPA